MVSPTVLPQAGPNLGEVLSCCSADRLCIWPLAPGRATPLGPKPARQASSHEQKRKGYSLPVSPEPVAPRAWAPCHSRFRGETLWLWPEACAVPSRLRGQSPALGDQPSTESHGAFTLSAPHDYPGRYMRRVSLSPLNRAGNQGQAFVHWTNASRGQSRARGAVAGCVASACHRALSFGTQTEGWPHEPTHVDRSEVTRQPAGAGAVRVSVADLCHHSQTHSNNRVSL